MEPCIISFILLAYTRKPAQCIFFLVIWDYSAVIFPFCTCLYLRHDSSGQFLRRSSRRVPSALNLCHLRRQDLLFSIAIPDLVGRSLSFISELLCLIFDYGFCEGRDGVIVEAGL
ncbi:hypothetical protein L6164_005484 [Bauhinia variegata]|uniref:Uncharacterized protein n=1 Tax=Bauhinia variegata TaxID=167791 RepID=A0ACB9PRF5_BAUVA|nr:hypothetical protein L6164_005484 [Bauhinia variegata]